VTDAAVDVRGAGAAEAPEWVRDALGGATGRGIRVAVVDSGWDRTLDEPRVLPGVGFVDPADDFAMARNDDDADVLGHGTACADLILRIAPDARVIPVKVFGKVLETSPGTLHAALLWAIDAGVQVINVSLGTRLEGTLHPLYAACEKARRAGIIIVAAGHNANDWSYPAIFENVIGVSAGRFDSPYHFRYRPEHAMECEAWGVEQPVLWVGGERVVKYGTSFAAPNVAGIVALILERHPGATLEQVREMLSGFALSVDLSVPAEDDPGEAPGAAAAADARPARKAPAKKAAAKKPRAGKAPAKAEAPAAETAARKPAAKKAAARKATAKKPAAKAGPSTAASGGVAETAARQPAAKKPRGKKVSAKAESLPAASADERRTDEASAEKAVAKKPPARKSRPKASAAG
jgi:subtilisin